MRGGHTYGTYVLAEPDGAAHLHDKDIPTAWEQNYYRGGDDDGVVRCETLGATVGLMSGWEWARNRTSGRVRAGGAQLVLGGMCWPSLPTNWPGPLRRLTEREHGIWREQARALPGQVARLTGVPVAHASHVGPITGETPLGPGIPWPTDDDRRVAGLRPRRHDPGAPDPRGRRGARERRRGDRASRRRSTRSASASGSRSSRMVTHAAWHGMNAHGALKYRLRHARKGFEWQHWPAGDLPDEIEPQAPAEAPHATTS